MKGYLVDVALHVRVPVYGALNWSNAMAVAKRYAAGLFPEQVLSVGYTHVQNVDGPLPSAGPEGATRPSGPLTDDDGCLLSDGWGWFFDHRGQ